MVRCNSPMWEVKSYSTSNNNVNSDLSKLSKIIYIYRETYEFVTLFYIKNMTYSI